MLTMLGTKPFTKLLKDDAKATRIHAAVLRGQDTKVDVPRRKLSVRSLRDASRLPLPQSAQVSLDVIVNVLEREGDNRVPVDSSPIDTHEAMVRLPQPPSSGASDEGTSEPGTDVLHSRFNEHERA